MKNHVKLISVCLLLFLIQMMANAQEVKKLIIPDSIVTGKQIGRAHV